MLVLCVSGALVDFIDLPGVCVQGLLLLLHSCFECLHDLEESLVVGLHFIQAWERESAPIFCHAGL